MENLGLGSRFLLVLMVFFLGNGIRRGLKDKKIYMGCIPGTQHNIVFYKNKSPIAYWTTIVTWVLLIIFFIFLFFIDFFVNLFKK